MEATRQRQILVRPEVYILDIIPRKYGSAEKSGAEGTTVDIITHKRMQQECLIGGLRLSV